MIQLKEKEDLELRLYDDDNSILKMYFRDISKQPLMTSEEEHGLAMKIRSAEEEINQAIYPTRIGRTLYRSILDTVRARGTQLRYVLMLDNKVDKEGMIKARQAFEDFVGAIIHRKSHKKISAYLDGYVVNAGLRTSIREVFLNGLETYAGRAYTYRPRLNGVIPEELMQDYHSFGIAPKQAVSKYETLKEVESRMLSLRGEFVKRNLRLVIGSAKMYNRIYFNNNPNSFMDLIQEGNIGLAKAVESFDVTRGYRFSTYATHQIRHHVSRAVCEKLSEGKVPVYMFEAVQLLKHVEKKFYKEHPGKGDPTDEDLMNIIDCDKDKYKVLHRTKLSKVREARRFLNPLYLNDHVHVDDGEGDEFLDLICRDHTPSPEQLVQEHEASTVVGSMVKTLDRRTQRILRIRSQDKSLKETGELLGQHKYLGEYIAFSRERIRQLENAAIQDIRERLDIRC